MRTLIRVKVDEEKEWYPAWEEALDNYLKLLKNIDNMRYSKAPFAENFKKLLELEAKNSPIDLPSSVLSDMVKERLKDSPATVIDEKFNCEVTVEYEKLQIKLAPYNNRSVRLRDNHDYLFPVYQRNYIPDTVKSYAIPYKRFKDGEITKHQLLKEFMVTQRKNVEDEGRTISKVRLLRNAIKDVYLSNWSRISGVLDNALDVMDEEILIAEKQKEINRKNHERSEQRIKILKESGLMDFLLELKNSGIKIEEDGMVSGLKWFEE